VVVYIIVISRHSSSILKYFFFYLTFCGNCYIDSYFSFTLYTCNFLIRLKNIHTLLKSDKVEVRNSPLDRWLRYRLSYYYVLNTVVLGLLGKCSSFYFRRTRFPFRVRRSYAFFMQELLILEIKY